MASKKSFWESRSILGVQGAVASRAICGVNKGPTHDPQLLGPSTHLVASPLRKPPVFLLMPPAVGVGGHFPMTAFLIPASPSSVTCIKFWNPVLLTFLDSLTKATIPHLEKWHAYFRGSQKAWSPRPFICKRGSSCALPPSHAEGGRGVCRSHCLPQHGSVPGQARVPLLSSPPREFLFPLSLCPSASPISSCIL